MKIKPEKKEEKDTQLKKGFFKKIWYSIDKIDKYAELSAEGLGRAFKYLVILMIILACITSIGIVKVTAKTVNEFANYIENKVLEINFKDGKLSVKSEEVMLDDKTEFGKIIIDTNIEDEETINKYIEDINEEERAIIILKDKIIRKEMGIIQTINYSEIFKDNQNLQFNNKQEFIDYIKNPNIMLNTFVIYLILFFISHIIYALIEIIFISIFAYLATIILRLKMRYVAVFNMVVYAITLPTLLQMLYLVINIFYPYTIAYFDLMYILVASIYVMAAIFILKGEFNKKQGEVQKILEVEEKVKEEIEKQKEEKEEESKKENKETKNKKKKEDDDEGEAPEGSNA